MSVISLILNRFAFLALLVSAGPILVISHGVLGTGSAFTGAFLFAITALMLGFARWGQFENSPSDILFALLLSAIAVSFALNGATANSKESALLVLSLAAYPACRLAPEGNRAIFLWITTAIVLIGTAATATALVEQWHHPHGKPYVFGQFDAAPIEFLTSLGFVIVAVVCTPLNTKRMWIISGLICLPLAIFAASQVRFTFAAIAAALIVAAWIGEPAQRKYVLSILMVVILSCVAGMAARSTTTAKFLKHEVSSISEDTAQPSNADCPTIDRDNSLAIRGQLLRDAVSDLPRSGMFGIGLDGFLARSCMGSLTQIHNSFLQAFVEFGWVGGSAFLLLVLSSIFFISPICRHDYEARFVLCSLVFMILESLAHGRLSRDAVLFLFIGYAVGLQTKVLKALQLEETGSYHLRVG